MPYKDKKKRKEYLHEYYLKNKAKLDKINKDWRKAHPNEARQIQKRYYAKNSEEINHKTKIYLQEHKDKVSKSNKLAKVKYPQRYKARYLTKRTPLKKNCEICSSQNNLQRHHWNYDKPSISSTVCRPCHTIQHIGKFKESKYGGIAKS